MVPLKISLLASRGSHCSFDRPMLPSLVRVGITLRSHNGDLQTGAALGHLVMGAGEARQLPASPRPMLVGNSESCSPALLEAPLVPGSFF